ncbi:ribonuclease H-like domain-containing protein [Leptospira kobayashii]|nr:ribonuclease H-like domain-containing protein [Leptospira kobayashii]
MDSKHSDSMIRSCFEIISGIGPVLQSRLWDNGILDWDDLYRLSPENWGKIQFLPSISFLHEEAEFLNSKWKEKDFLYFVSKLPNKELWRLWEDFPHKFCYLDIETTGIDETSFVTVASFYLNGEMFTFERGKNLEFMLDDLSDDLILVTYNGKRFDVPFLEKEFNQKISNVHLDLMNVLHDMGIKGGLKKSEIQLGLIRPEEIQSVDGKMAPLLWRDYVEYDDLEKLNLLIAYNREDTKNLESILREVVSRKKKNFDNLYL